MLDILFILSASVQDTWSIVSLLLTLNIINHSNYSELGSFFFSVPILVCRGIILALLAAFIGTLRSKRPLKEGLVLNSLPIYYAVMFCNIK